MLRDPRSLDVYAQFVAADLTRTLDGSWSCTVSDEFVLRVIGPIWNGVAEIDQHVDDEDEWDPDAFQEELETLIDDDAGRAVVDQVVELLGNTQRDWPICPAHGRRLEVADGQWQCSDLEHEPIPIGQLGTT